jgi:hyperosmotically inducible protein
MRNFEKWMFIGGASAVMAMAAGLTGCATQGDERTATQKLDDRMTAHRVRQELSKSPVYKFSSVGVLAFEGQVQLNGFVNTDDQKSRAEEIARNTPGVAQIINNIGIKQEMLTPTGRPDEANATANPPPPRSNPPQ